MLPMITYGIYISICIPTFLVFSTLQGYFLLRYLAQLVGVGKFDEVLRSYIEKYHGQLVLSKVSLFQ